jgi:K+-transporting ATPase ATPase A chain
MTAIGIAQLALYLLVLLLLVKPLGWYIAQVYSGNPCGLNQLGSRFEYRLYKICGIDPQQEMDWKAYLTAMLIFNLLGFFAVYLLQSIQAHLPLNPQTFTNVAPSLAFNTASSFVTNTNWQAYAGETTLSYLTQMLALTVQNFVSAATGMALLMAFIRGLTQHANNNLGNFWLDMVRGVLYILLPLSLLLALLLTSQGVIQNYKPYQTAHLIQPIQAQATINQQLIPMGPVASQVAIKQLGTNGGGFFNTNSAHPFENPTPVSNFFEMLAILLIPAALCYSFGLMVRDKRQGWAVLLAMFIIFIPCATLTIMAEQQGNPALIQMGVDPTPQYATYAAGNMEGKEVRFGITSSALWAAATTAASNGSVNSMHDSYTPLGGLIPLWLMHLGEVIFGGVGSGLYGMLILVIITVFVAGLMVGRTPEYLGKKIEPFEMKMAAVTVLLVSFLALVSTAVATLIPAGVKAIANPGAHGFTEILYAFSSMASNNGSAFAGLQANNHFYNIVGGIIMLMSRYGIAIPVLAIAGSLASKKSIPVSTGTLETHTPLFIALLIGIILTLGALSFLPALALGPIVEHLILWGQYGH